ncbi:hypothetical protein KSP40_PGU007146 [Platanthera guangdongensis]|uniref:Ubiquitin-like domain-containing protein n=1 Tax=Platanthera guangdongensis TaxID=2320717 RepID=A0ABR2LVZ4_9ASPA
MLREEVARRSGGSCDCINLICGGKILKDDGGSDSLLQLGLGNNSKPGALCSVEGGRTA